MSVIARDSLAFIGAFRPQNSDGFEPRALENETFTQTLDGLRSAGYSDQTVDAIDNTTRLWQEGRVFKFDLIAGYPHTSNNNVELFVNGTRAFPHLFEDIDNATSSIHISYYIFKDDVLGRQFIDKLIAAHERGVEVRVEMDSLGSNHLIPFSSGRRAANMLEEAGIQVVRNYPFSAQRDEIYNNPDHRKICVIDGRIAYSGGMNMAKPYLDEFHDFMVRMQGDIVQHVQSEWINSWMHLGGSIGEDLGSDVQAFQARYFPVCPVPHIGSSASVNLVQTIPGAHDQVFKADLDLINAAQESLYLEFPYLTDDTIEAALAAAAKRGVDVHIILPGHNDSRLADRIARNDYVGLLKAGCKIYDYPGFCHGKALVADGAKVKIGTSNLDPLSLHRIYEIDFVVDDKTFARTCTKDIFEPDIAASRRIELPQSRFASRLFGNFLALFTPWS